MRQAALTCGQPARQGPCQAESFLPSARPCSTEQVVPRPAKPERLALCSTARSGAQPCSDRQHASWKSSDPSRAFAAYGPGRPGRVRRGRQQQRAGKRRAGQLGGQLLWGGAHLQVRARCWGGRLQEAPAPARGPRACRTPTKRWRAARTAPRRGSELRSGARWTMQTRRRVCALHAALNFSGWQRMRCFTQPVLQNTRPLLGQPPSRLP